MQFSFKYCIVPKDHKSEEVIKASAVYMHHQDIRSDSYNRMEIVAGSVQKMEGEHLKIKELHLCLL